MSGLFLLLYNFFKTRRLLLTLLVFAVVAISIFFIMKVRLQEDISKMMPRDSKIDQMNMVFQNSKFSDKIIIHLYLQDTTGNANPEALENYSDQLAASLQKLSPGMIKEITHKISDDFIFQVYNTFYDNLPLFLSAQDYAGMDSLISVAGIESALAKNYKTLISPASLVLKQFILKDPVGITSIALKKLQSLQIEENYEVENGYILTKDKKHLVLFISPTYPSNETSKNALLLTAMDDIIDSLGKVQNPKINTEYFGAAVVAAGNSQRIKSDVTLTVSIAISILVLFISFFFRRLTVVVIIFIPVVIGGAIALALLYFFKPELSIIAIGMGAMLLGITIDYSLHIFTHYRSTGSVKEVLHDLSTPLMLSCLITASSFLCLLFVKSEALQELGVFAALSVVCAAITALILLPHFLKADEKNVNKDHGGTGLGLVDKYTAYEFDKNKILILAIILISVICAFTYQHVQFESDMMRMNYVSEKVKKAEGNLNKISSLPLNSIYVVSTGKTLEEALSHNETILGELDHLQEKGIIKKYSSPSLLLLSDSLQKIKISKWNSYWSAGKKDSLITTLKTLSKKYKFKEEAFNQFYNLLQKEYHVAPIAEFDQLRKVFLDDYISEKTGLATVVNLLKVSSEDKEKVYSRFPESANTIMIDKKYITSKFVALMSNDFNMLEFLSLGLVFCILILSYGRLELGIISFVPMSLSWLWTLGIMAIFGIKFNIINIIISTFILGLGIDYSIFIMSGLQQEYKFGQQHLASYKTSIFLSAFTTIVGIGAMVFAKHPALNSIALLCIIGMLSIIIISYTVEPLLFRLLITNRTKKGFLPFTFQSLLLTIFAYIYFLLGCLIASAFGFIFFKVLPGTSKKKRAMFHTMLQYFCKSILFVMRIVRLKVINEGGEKFHKPALIIANHQSFLDILIILSLHNKTVMITNDWVWNSPFFGYVVKMGGFFPASQGSEEGLALMEQKVKDGFSIMVFPEGTRSEDGNMKRFHKGAFLMAERLSLDIIPIVLHGTGNSIVKGDFLLGNGVLTAKILPRIFAQDITFGSDYSERTKKIALFFKMKYQELKLASETPAYYRDRLIKSFIYKGPVLEWYLRVKLRLEKNYEQFHEIIPRNGQITDIGCGYGFLCYMLAFLSPARKITGIDYDAEKIGIAANCFSRTSNMEFRSVDASNASLPQSDVFILNDVLHYLPLSEQEKLVTRCAAQLLKGGMIIIRDGNSDLKERHKGTKLTEIFSTKIFKFNKTTNELFFFSEREILKLGAALQMTVQIIDKTVYTSNTIYILKHMQLADVA